MACLLDYVGVDTTTPMENAFPVGTNPNGGGPGTSFTYGSVTTTVANSLVVFTATAFTSTAATTITPATGATDRVQLTVSGASSITSDESDITQASAGAVSKTGSIGANASWGTIVFALKPASGTLAFAVSPAVPNFPTLTLDGQAQTLTAQMPNFAVDDTTGSGSGWNVTVQGDPGTGKSAVFEQYCPNATCGTDAGPGYVSGGATFAAGSLKLSSTGTTWATVGGAGAAPAFQCSTACSLDLSSPTKIVSAVAGGGKGPWAGSGFGAGSLSLSAPTTTRSFSQPGEVYHADLLWTLSSGP